MKQPEGLFALMAEFSSPGRLRRAIRRTRESGYKVIEAYTPYPMEEITEELGHHRSKLPLIVLLGGIIGALSGFGFQYWKPKPLRAPMMPPRRTMSGSLERW